jgi:hypothetical protein
MWLMDIVRTTQVLSLKLNAKMLMHNEVKGIEGSIREYFRNLDGLGKIMKTFK